MLDKKKRLEEILPNPERVPEGARQPRDRVLGKLKKLSAGVAGLTTMGCIGFGVVDPIPEPSRCVDVQDEVTAQAVFVQDAQLGLVLQVTTPLNTASAQVGAFNTSASGATFNSTVVDVNANTFTVILTGVQPGQVLVFIQSECLGDIGTFIVTLDVPANPTAGTVVAAIVSAE